MRSYEHVLRAARRLEQELQIAIDQGTADQVAGALCAAAEEAFRAGGIDEAVDLLERAAATGPRRALLARIRYFSGMADRLVTHETETWREVLVTEAHAVEAEDPELAARLLISAALNLTGDLEPSIAAARKAASVARRAGEGAAGSAALAVEIVRVLNGESIRPRVLERALDQLDEHAFDGPVQMHRIAVLALWTEDYGTARRILERLLGRLRETRHYLLPTALDTLAALDLRTGRWSSAETKSAEALRIARASGQTWQMASCLTTLGLISALTGQELDCRSKLSEAHQLAPTSDLVFAWSCLAGGLLELGMGRPAAAVEELERLDSLQGVGPSVVPWLTNLVEARARSGELDGAAAALEELDAQSRRSKSLSTAAATARCRGLVARSGFDAHFSQALDLHSRLATPFETARTQLCYGERLRRARRRAEARVQLGAARTTFEYLGATPWADRAQKELTASRPEGARPKEGATEHLSAHELQVAALVCRGGTNREAATALFVSPKTVEYHLGNIYRKLDIRSRTELTRLLSPSL